MRLGIRTFLKCALLDLIRSDCTKRLVFFVILWGKNARDQNTLFCIQKRGILSAVLISSDFCWSSHMIRRHSVIKHVGSATRVVLRTFTLKDGAVALFNCACLIFCDHTITFG